MNPIHGNWAVLVMPFVFTGNDYLQASSPYYRGITGTDARTLSLWVKTTENYRDIAYWGSNINGQRWWLRMYRNELRVDFRNAVRRTFTKKLNDGLWHHVVQLTRLVVISRNTVRLYIDGAEGEFYGQWGQTNVSTGVNDSFRIGARLG